MNLELNTWVSLPFPSIPCLFLQFPSHPFSFLLSLSLSHTHTQLHSYQLSKAWLIGDCVTKIYEFYFNKNKQYDLAAEKANAPLNVVIDL